jgi:hypothetical protein
MEGTIVRMKGIKGRNDTEEEGHRNGIRHLYMKKSDEKGTRHRKNLAPGHGRKEEGGSEEQMELIGL